MFKAQKMLDCSIFGGELNRDILKSDGSFHLLMEMELHCKDNLIGLKRQKCQVTRHVRIAWAKSFGRAER